MTGVQASMPGPGLECASDDPQPQTVGLQEM